jgi:hypothetical protein
MSDAVGPGDLVLCVNVAPNHGTGRPVPLVAGETYRVVAVMDFACPCGRASDSCPNPRPRPRRAASRRLGRRKRFDKRPPADRAACRPRETRPTASQGETGTRPLPRLPRPRGSIGRGSREIGACPQFPAVDTHPPTGGPDLGGDRMGVSRRCVPRSAAQRFTK